MKSIISFLVGIVIVVGAEYTLWRHSLGSFNNLASYWIADLYTLKEHVADATPSPKILIMSGSNGMFGLDSEELSKLVGNPVVNMASHAGLPLDYIEERVLPHVHGGDVVVAPLEFEYYRRDPSPSEFEVMNMESWGTRYMTETFTRKISYFRSTYMLRALRDYLAPIPAPIPGTLKNIMARAEINTRRGVSKWDGYSVESANSYGDMLVDLPSTYKESRNYITAPPRQEMLNKLVQFNKAVEAKGGRLFLTWPVQSLNPLFYLPSIFTQQSINETAKALEEKGLHLNCRLADFNYQQSLFFNTEYHLSLEGAERRTATLAACIVGRPVPVDPEAIVAQRRAQAALYDQVGSRSSLSMMASRASSITWAFFMRLLPSRSGPHNR